MQGPSESRGDLEKVVTSNWKYFWAKPDHTVVDSDLFFSTMSRLKYRNSKNSLTNENDSNFPAWLKVNNKLRFGFLRSHLITVWKLYLYSFIKQPLPLQSIDQSQGWTLLYLPALTRQYNYLSNKWLAGHHTNWSQFIAGSIWFYQKTKQQKKTVKYWSKVNHKIDN